MKYKLLLIVIDTGDAYTLFELDSVLHICICNICATFMVELSVVASCTKPVEMNDRVHKNQTWCNMIFAAYC